MARTFTHVFPRISMFGDLLKSKKFRVFLVGFVMLLANDVLHLGVTHDTAEELVALVIGYMGAQGLADALPGKEKVRAEAETVDAQVRLAQIKNALRDPIPPTK